MPMALAVVLGVSMMLPVIYVALQIINEFVD